MYLTLIVKQFVILEYNTMSLDSDRNIVDQARGE